MRQALLFTFSKGISQAYVIVISVIGFFLYTPLVFAQSNTSSLTYLTLDATPADTALSGAGGASPGRIDGMLANPALLTQPYFTPTMVPFSIYYGNRPFFFDEFRNNLILARFSIQKFDIGAYTQIVSSDPMRFLDDLGDQVGFKQFGFFSGGVGLSYKFFKGEQFFVAGVNLKGWQSRLGDYTASGFATDIGGIFYFSLPRPVLLRYVADIPNSSFGFTVKNIGTPAKYIEEEEPSPMSYDLTLRTGVYAFQIHQFDLLQAFRHDIELDTMKYSVGGEYVAFSIVFVRASIAYNITHSNTSATTSFALGGGLKDRKFENFGYSLDYAFAHSPLDGGSHVFGVGLTYYLAIPPEPLRVNVELDLEMVAEAQRVVQDVKLKKRRVPASQIELYQEMKDRGYPQPRLTAGRMLYLPEVEQVIYIRDGESAEKVYLITLKDGSAILGNITKSNENQVDILTSAGPFTVPVANIEKIVSSDFSKMDDVAKLRAQFLVLEYRKKEGRLPVSLEELQTYAAALGWIMPSPVTHRLEYNARTGEVTLEKKGITDSDKLKEQKDSNSRDESIQEKTIDPSEIIDPLKKKDDTFKGSDQILPGG